MTLTILLKCLQLLQTASIREPDRTRGSFLWQHALIATLRFLTFPRARFRTSSTQNIASAFKPTDFTQRRTNQSSRFQSTPRRPASSVSGTFPLHKFMASSAQKNKYGTMWCKIGCGTPTSSTLSLRQSRIVTTIKKSQGGGASGIARPSPVPYPALYKRWRGAQRSSRNGAPP